MFMLFEDYFSKFGEGIEFLVALGSILGLLGLIVGLLGAMTMSSRMKAKFYGLILVSIILLSVCGLHTGTKYFRIY